MLDAALKAQLQAYFERIAVPVELVASLDDSEKSREMLALLEDIASISPKITVSRVGADARKPSFAINRVGTNISTAFAGLPMGHEFNSLVLALLQVGGLPPKNLRRSSSRSTRSKATICSRPSSRSPARTAPTWCRR